MELPSSGTVVPGLSGRRSGPALLAVCWAVGLVENQHRQHLRTSRSCVSCLLRTDSTERVLSCMITILSLTNSLNSE